MISIELSHEQRNILLHWYQYHHLAQVSKRCHIILLLNEGRSWSDICQTLYCSSRTISRWKQRFLDGGIEALQGRKLGRKPAFSPCWPEAVTDLVDNFSPSDFGYLRSRWCCWLLAAVLGVLYKLQVSRETVRRWLHQENYVYRRPRPVLTKKDPERAAIFQGLRKLLRDLPSSHTVLFQDEVDLNLNPEIGRAWMSRGYQSEIVTPGNNEKKYLAGSLNWRSGELIQTIGPKRNDELFINHLSELVEELSGKYEKIHVILDNAKFHSSAKVQSWLAKHGKQLELHFLPKYSPDLNPIERVWWHLREEITRNHKCKEIEELIELTLLWLWDRAPMEIEGSAYKDLDPHKQQ